MDIIGPARALVSVHGENPEYDRALTELVCDLTGVPWTDKGDVARLLGVHPDAIAAWRAPDPSAG